MQNITEINLVFQDWLDNFAPRNLVHSEQNSQLIADYIATKRHGIVTTTTLNQAVEDLRDQLEFAKELPQKTQAQMTAEFVAKEQKRILREKLENSKPFDIEARNKVAETEKAEVKRQAVAQAQIENIVANYSVNAGPGRIDASKSQAGQAALRGIKINKGGKYDAPLTLTVIRQSYNFDTPREIIQAAERATMNLADADKPKTLSDRREEQRNNWLHRPR